MIINNKATELLKKFTEAHSIPGHEDRVRSIFLEELHDCGEFVADKNGSVACVKAASGPRIMVAGHMDEVGFLVQNITSEGFIQFVSVGGWWTHTLLSQRVYICNKKGELILGVISSKPPHFLPASQKKQVLPEESLFIDIGAESKQEVMESFNIHLGCSIAPATEFTPMAKKGYFLAKAFDNRVGMAGAVQVMQELKTTALPCELLAAGTVQEEVGLRGAKTLASLVKPDLAIVLEGPPADDIPGFPRQNSQGKLGGGVQIRLSDPTAISNPRLADHVINIAKKSGVNHQVTVRRSGGTDAGSFHQANHGIPSIVIGTPARYIHSHNSMICIDDYKAMVDLTKALVASLDQETVASFTDFLA